MKNTHLAVALLIMQLGRTVWAQELSLGSCQIFGQVFGVDPLGGDMLVKSPSGDIGGLRFHLPAKSGLHPGPEVLACF